MSPRLKAAQLFSTYNLIIIHRYNHSAFACHLYSQDVTNTTVVASDAQPRNLNLFEVFTFFSFQRNKNPI